MYTLEKFEEGIKYLEITVPIELHEILVSQAINREYLEECKEKEKYRNRFNVERGLTKKEYTAMEEEATKILADLRAQLNKAEWKDKLPIQIEQDNYLQKKEKLKLYMKPMKKGEMNIAKAKEYPIDQLLEFRGSHCCCIFHDERTPSMKYYPKTNRAHCFGACGKSFDSIDIYQQLNNVDFATAVQALQ
jgi:DNA primase